MQDKPTDDDTLSLNQFDSMDEKLRTTETDRSEAFNALLELNATDDDQLQEDRQAPSIPEPFDATDLNETSITPKFEHQDNHLQADAPQHQEKSHGKMIAAVVIIAILIFAGAVWLNMDEKGTADQSTQQQAEVQLQHIEKQLSTLRERLSQMDERLLLKNERIAELSHLLAESARQQTKSLTKQASPPQGKQKAVSAKKPLPKVQPLKTSMGNKHALGWVIVMASLHSRSAAEKARLTLKAKGINTDIRPITVKGKTWYRIQVSGFANRQEANAQKAYLTKHHGISDTWIHQLK